MPDTFTVEGFIHIAGRGWAITRSTEAARAARDAGVRWKPGDNIRCDGIVALVKGVENDLLPDRLNSQGGLLLDIAGPDVLQIGQVWERVVFDRQGRVVDPEPEKQTECDHVDDSDHFVYSVSGARLCWECTSAFVSWMLDGGQQASPDLFAWALDA